MPFCAEGAKRHCKGLTIVMVVGKCDMVAIFVPRARALTFIKGFNTCMMQRSCSSAGRVSSQLVHVARTTRAKLFEFAMKVSLGCNTARCDVDVLCRPTVSSNYFSNSLMSSTILHFVV